MTWGWSRSSRIGSSSCTPVASPRSATATRSSACRPIPTRRGSWGASRLMGGEPRRLQPIPGQPPSLTNVPSGCAFHPRCADPRAVASAARSGRYPCRRARPRVGVPFLVRDGALLRRPPRAGARPPMAEAAPTPNGGAPAARLARAAPPDRGPRRPLRRRRGPFNRSNRRIHAVEGVSLDVSAGRDASASWVSRAAASRPPLGPSFGSSSRPPGGSSSTASTSPISIRKALRPIRRELQMVFQDPYGSLNPRLPIAEIIAEPLKIHGQYRKRTGRARVDEVMSLVGLTVRIRQALPAPAVGRAAPARRDRTRSRAEPEAPDPRRACLRARRVDPGAGHQPARGHPGAARASPFCSSPTTCPSSARSRPGCRDVPRQGDGARHSESGLRPAGASVYPGAAVRRSRRRPRLKGPQAADHPQGRCSKPGRSADRVRVPHALLATRAARQPHPLRDRGRPARGRGQGRVRPWRATSRSTPVRPSFPRLLLATRFRRPRPPPSVQSMRGPTYASPRMRE